MQADHGRDVVVHIELQPVSDPWTVKPRSNRPQSRIHDLVDSLGWTFYQHLRDGFEPTEHQGFCRAPSDTWRHAGAWTWVDDMGMDDTKEDQKDETNKASLGARSTLRQRHNILHREQLMRWLTLFILVLGLISLTPSEVDATTLHKIQRKDGSYIIGEIQRQTRYWLYVKTKYGRIRLRISRYHRLKVTPYSSSKPLPTKATHYYTWRRGIHPNEEPLLVGMYMFGLSYIVPLSIILYTIPSSNQPATLLQLLPFVGPIAHAGVIISERKDLWAVYGGLSLGLGIVQGVSLGLLYFTMKKSRPKIPFWKRPRIGRRYIPTLQPPVG